MTRKPPGVYVNVLGTVVDTPLSNPVTEVVAGAAMEVEYVPGSVRTVVCIDLVRGEVTEQVWMEGIVQ